MRARVIGSPDELPPGFIYRPDFLDEGEERELVRQIGTIEFSAVRMRGVVARRRVAQYGWGYSFETFRLTEAPPAPHFLRPLQSRAAALAGIAPGELAEVLITEYQPGATIGWHRDLPVFGVVVGISLNARCTFKLRRRVSTSGEGAPPLALDMSARSAYVLDGEARRTWEHSIPAVKALRYSITFRTLKTKKR